MAVIIVRRDSLGDRRWLASRSDPRRAGELICLSIPSRLANPFESPKATDAAVSEPPPRKPNPPPRANRPFLRLIVHGCRAILFGLILLLIHWQHEKRAGEAAQNAGKEPAMDDVELFLPEASQLAAPHESTGWTILDAAETEIGFAVETLPAADDVIGFSGPTNLLLVFNKERQLAGAKVLSSRDTKEHVEAVVESDDFFQPLLGTSWDQIAAGEVSIDTVSGATLTSVAIGESIQLRLGGEKRSSHRFPESLTVEDVQKLFPAGRKIGDRVGSYGLYEVLGDNDEILGHVLRTSPAADGLIGYQGPTDSLVAFDPNGRYVGFMILGTYDNEPYVGYVREDEYFASLFEGMTIPQLAKLDLKAAGIEGVSGATMTSINVAEGFRHAAIEAERQRRSPQPAPRSSGLNLSPRDWGTCLVVLAGLVIGFTDLRGKKWVRVPFQFLLIGYLGFINGDLVSQALIVGWAEHGVPWRSASGLVFLTLAALVVPIFSRQNIYCHQICPHGAAQQLLKNRVPWQWSLPGWAVRVLSTIPFALLVLVVLATMLSWPLSLVDLEPFDAYVFRVAGTVTIVIFVVGLTASLFVPMAYCRFGCPTGAVLGFLRFHGKSDRLNRRDALAVGLLALALLLFATK